MSIDTSNRRRFFDLIVKERERQTAKWGESERSNRLFNERFFAILGEEFGELCRASLESDEENFLEELVQVAAVCTRMYELIAPASERGGSR